MREPLPRPSRQHGEGNQKPRCQISFSKPYPNLLPLGDAARDNQRLPSSGSLVATENRFDQQRAEPRQVVPPHTASVRKLRPGVVNQWPGINRCADARLVEQLLAGDRSACRLGNLKFKTALAVAKAQRATAR